MTRRLSLNSSLSDVITRNGLHSVAAMLDGDRRASSNNYILDRSSSRSRMVGSTSVEDEVLQLIFFKYMQLLFKDIILMELKYSSMLITQ
ncbi:hypothetical protein ACJMK2_018201 [Sinanodonta woodiana]|uniref:Uncharacterized protein n=1 Tax=Sinanodonta woodiana TaxID=1069815 RepID=A0ABD3UGB0_SINWO